MLLPIAVNAQLVFRSHNGVTSTMQRADVIEIHSEDKKYCHSQTMVIWGSKRTGKIDTVAFRFTQNYIVLWNIEDPTKQDLDTAKKIALHQDETKIKGEKIFLLRDYLGDRYIVRILSGDTGYIVFINNHTHKYPQFILSFSAVHKLICP